MNPDRLQDYLEALQMASGDEARSRVLESARHRILSELDAAKRLIDLIGTEPPESTASESLLLLLEVALEAARVAQENGQREGARFLADVEKQLKTRTAAETFSTMDRLALGRAYIHAGLPPSKHLVTDPEDFTEFADVPDDVPDLDALLDSLRDEAGAEPMAIHMALSEMMSTLPDPVRSMMVDQTAQRPDTLYARVGTYWLLDGDAALRLAAAKGFLQRIQCGQMDAATASRLIGLRSWLPSDEARDVLDRLIKEAMRRDVAGGAAPKSWKLHKILASIPDGAGAQSILIAAQAGGQRVIAMLLLKQSFGVKDAYLIPCSSASEQKRSVARIDEEIDTDEVTLEFVHNALATALAEGVDAGVLPAPGLLDVAEVCGLQELRSQPRTVHDMLGAIDAEGELANISPQRLGRLVGHSREWPERFGMVESWFEDSDELHDSLEAARTPHSRERSMWHHLESRRGWWARIFARTAMTLHATEDPNWLEFAATALALENGRDLKKTPIMQFITQRSLENPDAPGSPLAIDAADEPDIEYLDEPDFVAPEKKGELARFLKAADISADWLDGYLMAVVVSPKMINPREWLEPLFSVLRSIPNKESLQRFLDIVMLRYNAANEAAQDTATSRGRLNRISARAWVDWAEGFATATTEFKSSWRARTLNKDDKAILKMTSKAADGGKDTETLRALLPGWLARRYDLRE
jgi:hypothetical protein